jgi:Domain of unknown function (DUF5666)
LNRREFIKHIAIGAGGATVLSLGPFSFATERSATAAPLSTSGVAMPPGEFIAGTVMSAVPGQIIVSSPFDVSIPLSLPSTARVWRGALTNPAAVQVGDSVRVWATPQGTPTTVYKLWANLINLRGTVTAGLESGTFSLSELRSQHAHTLEVANTTAFPSSGPDALTIGTFVFVIAYRDPATSTLTATRVDIVSLSASVSQ